LEKMLRDLGWHDRQVTDGDEPPDFFLDSADRRCAVEVTRIFQREHAKGSPDAAQEHQFEQFVSALRDAYFSTDAPQSIQVSVTLPAIIRSPAVRQWTREERRADLTAVMQRALARLRHLPKLSAWQDHKFHVRQRDGRPATFRVLCLPPGTGAERLWEVVSNHVGWVAPVDGALLQRKIAAKAEDLAKYRRRVVAAVLLVVADGSRASGFLDLPPGIVVDQLGFDAVYFQSYSLKTKRLPTIS
jgi:hypothetical protein